MLQGIFMTCLVIEENIRQYSFLLKFLVNYIATLFHLIAILVHLSNDFISLNTRSTTPLFTVHIRADMFKTPITFSNISFNHWDTLGTTRDIL